MIDELELSTDLVLDKTTIIYGESGTGKSVVIVDILHKLRDHAEQVLVISPTDRQNHTYDKGIVPIPCIHYNITDGILTNLWERQNALVSVYTRANRTEILRKLFERIPGNDEAKQAIANIYKRREEYVSETGSSTVRSADDKCKELIVKIFKRSISSNRDALSRMKLDPDEAFTLKYINLNPRLVIVFDDCTDLIKKFKAHPIMQKIFYQGRWMYITALIACHTDKALDAELRKNAYISIFTAEKSARGYIERGSNDLDKEDKKVAHAACKCAFTPVAPFQKLTHVRAHGKYYRFTAEQHTDFKFGSEVLWDFCKKIQAEAGAVSLDNKFIHDFM